MDHEPRLFEILQAISTEHDIIGTKIAKLVAQAEQLRDLDEARFIKPPSRENKGIPGSI
jgi:hypothetical protein